jgi:hypothetical protein
LSVIAVNARDLANFIGNPLSLDGASAIGVTGLPMVLSLVMMSFTAIGLWHARNRAPVSVAFVLCYLAIALVWPFEPHRFLGAIWPLLALFVVTGITQIADAMPKLTWVGVGLTSLGLLLPWARGLSMRDWERVPNAYMPSVASEVEWVAANAHPNDVVASDMELAVYLYTGRRAVPSGDFETADRVRAFAPGRARRVLHDIIQTYQVGHVVLSNQQALLAAKALADSAPSLLRLEAVMPVGAAFARLTP